MLNFKRGGYIKFNGDEVLIYVLDCAVELGIFDEWQHVTNGAFIVCAVVLVVRFYSNLELYLDGIIFQTKKKCTL